MIETNEYVIWNDLMILHATSFCKWGPGQCALKNILISGQICLQKSTPKTIPSQKKNKKP